MVVSPTRIDARKFPFIAQVVTEFPRNTTGGTGTLIGPRLVLTAGHVVFDPALGGDAERFVIILGTDRTRFVTSTWRTNDVWRNRDSRSTPAGRARSAADFGIIVLSQPVDTLVRPIQVETTPHEVLSGLQLNVAGYPVPPAGDGKTLFGASSTPAKVFPELQGTRMFYSINTLAGMSGGPAYDFDPQTHSRTVRGIHTSVYQGVGSALRITASVLSLIQLWQQQFRPI